MAHRVLVENLGAVRILTLNRPDKLNAADLAMQRQLLEEIRSTAGDAQVRVLILTGAGRAFCAGGDREILRQLADGTCGDRDELGEISMDIIRTMLELEIPAIAAVNGLAVGFAAGLVALCDLVVMGRGAFLSDPHVQYGIAATPAAQLIWPHLCSGLLARDILMSGRRVHAEEALGIGLCNRICDDGHERAAALEMAEPFLALPREGVAATKRAFNAPLLAEAVRAGFADG